MVVGHLGRQSGAVSAHYGPHAGPGAETAVHDPCARGNPHGGAVSKAVVWLPAVRPQPRPEPAAVTRVVVHPAVFLHGVDKSVSCPALHDGLRHGTGHDGIVREKTVLPEQGEVLRFDVIPLIDRAYNIANNCTNHLCPPFFSAPMQGIFFTSMFKIYHEKEREGSLTKRRRCKKGLGIILSPLYLILEKQQETEWVDKKADEIVL